MPLGKGVRYRYKTNPDGSKTRLAFRGNTAIEVKPEGRPAKMIRRSTRGSAPFTSMELARGYRRAVA